MTQNIRKLTKNDYPFIKNMQTGFEEDYVLHRFSNLLDDGDRLYGLFIDGQIACISGFSVTRDHYAMLGRLRSDKRFRGQGHATNLMKHVLREAFKIPSINWVGANTEEDNLPARHVLKHIGLTLETTLYDATADTTDGMKNNSKIWTPINDPERKLAWLKQTFIEPGRVFPYGCFYPLPATHALFTPEKLREWTFYENNDHTRMVIIKSDRKKHQYLHVIYPWDDLTQQDGLWETIAAEYEALKAQTTDIETYIWKDLTRTQASALSENHPFTLKSPWMLHGITRHTWEQTNAHKEQVQTGQE